MSGLVGMHGLQGLRSGHAGGGPEVYAWYRYRAFQDACGQQPTVPGVPVY
jgi:hypothetical protein